MLMMLRRIFPVLPLLCLAACSSPPPLSISPMTPSLSMVAPVVSGSVSFSPVPVNALPDWQQQQQLGHALAAIRQSCRVVAKQAQWASTCQDMASLSPDDNAAIRQFFEARFTAWKLQDGAHDSGLITGYYEPALNGSRQKSARTPYPLYGVPTNLMTLNVPPAARGAARLVARRASASRLTVVPGALAPEAGQVTVSMADFPADNRGVLKGRIENGKLMPYYSRAEIAQGRGVDHAPVLAWVQDPVELFFLQVQGSGRIQMDDGSVLRVGVGDTNGFGYRSIGRWLADRGEIHLSDATMQGLQSWVQAHPDRQQQLFNANPRYVFFSAQPEGNEGPVGTLGVPLTNGYSIAVDQHFIPLGAPVYLATTWPTSQQPLNRLVAAQDTGSAIRGAIRADFFWGYGAEAGLYAGRMKQNGSMWLLLPNGVQPPVL